MVEPVPWCMLFPDTITVAQLARCIFFLRNRKARENLPLYCASWIQFTASCLGVAPARVGLPYVPSCVSSLHVFPLVFSRSTHVSSHSRKSYSFRFDRSLGPHFWAVRYDTPLTVALITDGLLTSICQLFRMFKNTFSWLSKVRAVSAFSNKNSLKLLTVFWTRLYIIRYNNSSTNDAESILQPWNSSLLFRHPINRSAESPSSNVIFSAPPRCIHQGVNPILQSYTASLHPDFNTSHSHPLSPFINALFCWNLFYYYGLNQENTPCPPSVRLGCIYKCPHTCITNTFLLHKIMIGWAQCLFVAPCVLK